MKTSIKNTSKTLGLTILLLLCFDSVQSQTSLEFNQVLLVSNADTVPQGKVWKITGILPNVGFRYTASIVTSPYLYSIIVDGNIRYIGHTAFNNNHQYQFGYSMKNISKNIWLPSGTTLSAGTYVGEISVIEFNVNP